MAKKFVRGITDIKTINNQDFDTNNVNDLLSDGEHNYIHRKKGKTEEYHNLTDNIKTISSDNTELLAVTNNNKTTNSATLHPKHDAQKEQVIESTRNTITINHGQNATPETTKVDTNPEKVLEHTNLLTDYGISKTTSGNTTKLGLEYTKVIDGFDLNSLTSGSVRGNNLKNAPRTGWYFVDTFGDENNAIQNAKELLAPNTSFTRSRENGVWGQWREQVGDKSVIEGKIPKEIGTVNLFKGSRDFSGSNWINNSNGAYAEDYQGVKIYKTQSTWSGRSQYFEVKTGEEYVFSAYVKSSAKTEYVGFYLTHESKQPSAAGVVSYGSASNQDIIFFELTDKYKRIAIKIKITSSGWIMPRLEQSDTNAYLFFGGYKLERGNIATDYSPAPEDTQEQISKLLAQKQNTITNNTSIGVSGTGLRQLYTNKQTYSHDNGILKTHVKSISQNTSVSTAEEEYNFIVKINKGASSVNFTLNSHDTTKFSNIITTYGTENTVCISGCVFTLSGSTLTVSTSNNTQQNYVITFSDII